MFTKVRTYIIPICITLCLLQSITLVDTLVSASGVATPDEYIELAKRSIKNASLGAGLGISGALAGVAGYFTKTICAAGGAMATVFGTLEGKLACAASAAVFLVLSAVTGALAAGDTTAITKRDLSSSIYTGYLYHNLTGIHYSLNSAPIELTPYYNDVVSVLIEKANITNVKVADHIAANNETLNIKRDESILIHSLHFEHNGYKMHGFHFDNTIESYLEAFVSYNENSTESLQKRGTATLDWASFTEAWSDTQQEEEASGNASEEIDNGWEDWDFAKWIEHDTGNKYCLGVEWTSDRSEFMAGELYFNAYGGVDGECWDILE
ncbi:hypothetical protein KAFR_0G00100 [Kazachstania africana CBS 2517]|uniref:Uncharacterized protein n=1 Tax=Kazachstania africana (strain ATCC 22294 / BCRC 22015 / CBS 2517 / CECT 1963 / NBRC 1671 / NRRL Y-8276) TaxID=1071382 RepID=H2AXE3_KAZAF|nr:hypothetical protein KAFR_0G00100 [Kazachstania africana CBS 2517]CCF59043.1 hypothetical protein KAFR_0G00100 [Kazachstania africana CBS 2517]